MKTHQRCLLALLPYIIIACGNDGRSTDSPSAQSETESLTNLETAPATESNRDLDKQKDWWDPGEGRLLVQDQFYPNDYGVLQTHNQNGDINTVGHPFFEAIGSNGRACITCHQPADGMSLSLTSIQQRWQATQGRDPLFAAIDGANCPDLPQGDVASHSLLLEHGLIRIFRPWPPRDNSGNNITPQFDIEIVRDPSQCNTSSEYGLSSSEPMVSVFRRPRPAANLKYITAVGFPFEPKDGLPLPRDPLTDEQMSGNITADRRVWTLRDQARDALLTHLQFEGEPSETLLQQLVDFENQIFAAQRYDITGNDLAKEVAAGPEQLAADDAGVLNSGTRLPMWTEFDGWVNELTATEKGETPDSFLDLTTKQQAFRLSVARGVRLFRDKTFLVHDNAGITDMGFGNPVRNDCNFCHNMTRSGMDVAPGQVDLGTTNEPYADPSPHLPLFKLTCKPGYQPHTHLGPVVFTSDPGLALTTGQCKDIGKITIQSMRGLAGREPYFSNGSATDIEGIVDYYERRYRMQLSESEKQDLINLMSVL